MKIPAAVPVPGVGKSHSSSQSIPSAGRSIPKVNAPDDPRGLIGRVLGERYRITSIIGEGGMGVVFEAEQLAVGRLVAVKVLHPRLAQDHEAITRLRHEAKIAGTLGHPNICAIYDMGHLDDGSPYLVMERLQGETLAQRIAREKALPVVEIVDIALQALAALVVAHQKNVIHRDIKPDNIFLSRTEGRRSIPKLLDFGISKSEDTEETVADPTGAKIAAGTPFYMAPEQARGERIDHRVDLWSMGVILYEGLTGRRPFDANNYNALLVQILSTPAQSMRELRSGIPHGIAKVVERAIEKRSGDRFQSAKDFQNALHAALAEALGRADKSSKTSNPVVELKPSSQRNVQPDSSGQSVRNGSVAQGRYETSSDIVNASSTSLPMLIHDHPTEDPDATAVFTRIPMSALRAPQASAELSEESEDQTPIYGARDTVPNPLPPEFDEERTVVDPPPSFNETLTMVRRDLPVPPKKR